MVPSSFPCFFTYLPQYITIYRTVQNLFSSSHLLLTAFFFMSRWRCSFPLIHITFLVFITAPTQSPQFQISFLFVCSYASPHLSVATKISLSCLIKTSLCNSCASFALYHSSVSFTSLCLVPYYTPPEFCTIVFPLLLRCGAWLVGRQAGWNMEEWRRRWWLEEGEEDRYKWWRLTVVVATVAPSQPAICHT